MSMCHKAYEFAWTEFENDLLPILTRCLSTNDITPLAAWIEMHRKECRNPYDHELLATDWQGSLEVGDLQEVADFALTKYYDPAHDYGVGQDWMTLDDLLPKQASAALLGVPVGREVLFDPGRLGSYFQDPSVVTKSLSLLQSFPRPELTGFIGLLSRAVTNHSGIYVTF